MRTCAYCAVKCSDDIRVKVSDGPDLCFCSRQHALEVYHRLGDEVMATTPKEDSND